MPSCCQSGFSRCVIPVKAISSDDRSILDSSAYHRLYACSLALGKTHTLRCAPGNTLVNRLGRQPIRGSLEGLLTAKSEVALSFSIRSLPHKELLSWPYFQDW